mmetsp:Transcript_5827/g.14822  ORF Transcript_5827/g.14822 Transcript_5827/m.14822 type:complete len:228 (-) Transcript_5827:1062-1745(-)
MPSKGCGGHAVRTTTSSRTCRTSRSPRATVSASRRTSRGRTAGGAPTGTSLSSGRATPTATTTTKMRPRSTWSTRARCPWARACSRSAVGSPGPVAATCTAPATTAAWRGSACSRSARPRSTATARTLGRKRSGSGRRPAATGRSGERSRSEIRRSMCGPLGPSWKSSTWSSFRSSPPPSPPPRTWSSAVPWSFTTSSTTALRRCDRSAPLQSRSGHSTRSQQPKTR